MLGDVMGEKSERTRLVTINTYRPRALLMLFAAAVLAAGLLALVGAKPAWAVQWGFSDAQNFEVGESPYSVTSADLNGDGKKDLAVANMGNPTGDFARPGGVSVLLGNGDGSFQPKQDFEVATNRHPQSVTSAHFNDDGEVGNSDDDLADLVVPNPASDNVSVFLSNGDGTFQDPKIVAAGDAPRPTTSGDFDGDGNADLAVPNKISDDVSVLLGNGDGTFQAAQSFPAGDAPEAAINADFSGDGVTDLAVLRKSLDAVSVLLGNGNGTFQEPRSFPVEDETMSLTSADLDGDNKADFATAHRPSFGSRTSPPEGVSVFLSNGDGTFQAARNFPVAWSTSYRRNPEQVIAADFNRDKKQDLATSNRGAFFTGYHGVSLLLGKGDGTFQEAQEFEFGINPSSLTSTDFDGNNFPDLAVADEGHNDLNFETFPDNVSVLLDNPISHDIDVTIDSGPMGFPITEYVNSTTATFTFSSPQPGVTFDCKLDNEPYKACTSPKHYTNLSDGIHDFYVRAFDAEGPDLNPENWSWMVDTKAPDAETVSPADLATGVARGTNLTITFSEKVYEPTINGSTFKLYKCASTTSTDCTTQITNVAVGPTMDSQGATDYMSATLDPYGMSSTLLESGTKYKAVVTTGIMDEAGNALEQDYIWTFTTAASDTTPPSTTHTFSPQPNAAGWNNSNVTVTLSATDTGGSGIKDIRYSATGAQSIPETVYDEQNRPVINAEGTTTLSYFATDKAGNQESPTKTFTVKLDRGAPDASITSGPSGPTNDTTPTFSFGGSDNFTASSSLLLSYKVVADGAAAESMNWSEYSSETSATLGGAAGLAEGSYTFHVRAKDQAGNEDASPMQRSFTVDTSVPAPPVINSPENNSFNTDGTIALSGTAEESTAEGGNVTVQVYEDGTPQGTPAQVDLSGAWSATLPGVGEGSHTFKAKATDPAGNISGESNPQAVIVDTVRPAAPSTPDLKADSDTGSSFTDNVTKDTTPTFTGTAEAGAAVKIFDGTSEVGSATATSSGAYDIHTSTLANGTHSITVKATDAAGNTGPASSALSVKIDTTPPGLPGTPTHSLLAPSRLLSSALPGTIPVRLAWSAATDNTGGSGIATYQLQQSANGGTFTNVGQPSATTSLRHDLAPGTSTYRFQVSATDKAGNASTTFQPGPPAFKVSAFQESTSSPTLVDTGTWTTAALSGAYGGSVQHASSAGSKVTFSVATNTKNVAWVSTKASNRGKAQVCVDPGTVAQSCTTVDLYSASTQLRSVVFSKAVNPATSHKVEVRVLGQKHTSSTGMRVDVDAFTTTT
jgi:hypothetical protein